MSDPTHWMRTQPRNNKFDNHYLYYLYCKWYSEWWEENHMLYDDARKYLFEHISQIVYASKRKDINIPYHLHDDCNTEMYMIIDHLYRQIFNDTKEYDIVSQDGIQSRWTRFEKYYQPKQVYGMIKFAIKNRILTYLAKHRDNVFEDCFESLDYDICLPYEWEVEEINNQIACEKIIQTMLTNLRWVSYIEKWSFILVKLQYKTYEEVSNIMAKHWVDYSKYKIKKCVDKVLQKIKDDITPEDLLAYDLF